MADREKTPAKKAKMAQKKEKEPTEDQAEPLRKSSRIKRNAQLGERMSMFVMNAKPDSSASESEKSDDAPDKRTVKEEIIDDEEVVEEEEKEDDIEDDDDETEEPPKKVIKKSKEPAGKLSSPGKKIGRPKKKKESSDEEDVDDPGDKDEDADPDFNLGMLELKRVGDDAPRRGRPLNARGMPQRVRKKNKMFDDSVVNLPANSKGKPKRNFTEKKNRGRPRLADVEERKQHAAELMRDANSMRQKIGIKLRNLLKLPKAQRWVFNEFFYSNIDRVLFFGNNDFLQCVKETFGHLRTTNMTRTEWTVVRRLMGKPRRCSQNFFKEERQTLERRRDVIRLVQLRRIRDASQCRDLPDRIPLQLNINARVTAKLRYPQSGLFTGKVDAVDPSNHTYRITFDRPGLGTHSIPDYEVLLHGEPDMVSISAMQKRYLSHKLRPREQPPKISIPETRDLQRVWSNTTLKSHQFPRQFYEMIVRICKIMKEKNLKMQSIASLNNDAEKMMTLGEPYPLVFQYQYAQLLVELESLNISLTRYLTAVQTLCHKLAPEACTTVMLAPSFVREKSIADAKETLDSFFKERQLSNPNTAKLVVELMALVLQLQNITRPKVSTQDRLVLKQTLHKIKTMIDPQNLLLLQNSVEVHVKYIEAAFTDDSHLSPLMAPTTTAGIRKAYAAATKAKAAS